MPSSSEDLTLARITSPVKGRKTTKRKMTSVEQSEWVGMSVETSRGSSAPLYQKHPSPYRTFPSPTGAGSKTHIQSPTSCKTRLAYFLLSSFVSACSAGRENVEGWSATVSYEQLRFSYCGASNNSRTLMTDKMNISIENRKPYMKSWKKQEKKPADVGTNSRSRE